MRGLRGGKTLNESIGIHLVCGNYWRILRNLYGTEMLSGRMIRHVFSGLYNNAINLLYTDRQ